MDVSEDKEEHAQPSTVADAFSAATETQAPLASTESVATLVDIPTCARTDAKPLNRDTQMKYDIAKNEDGPLRRTMKGAAAGQYGEHLDAGKGKQKASSSNFGLGIYNVPAENHPGLAERYGNMETHLAVRYGKTLGLLNSNAIKANALSLVPSPPQSLLDRLKFLEDHIIKLEKENPPWAALHFNQPNRGVR